MRKPLMYSENHFPIGTRVCNKETGSIGIVQADFGDYEHSAATHGDLLDLIPVKWQGKENLGICPVCAVYCTDNFTTEFSNALKASVNADCWY